MGWRRRAGLSNRHRTNVTVSRSFEIRLTCSTALFTQQCCGVELPAEIPLLFSAICNGAGGKFSVYAFFFKPKTGFLTNKKALVQLPHSSFSREQTTSPMRQHRCSAEGTLRYITGDVSGPQRRMGREASEQTRWQ